MSQGIEIIREFVDAKGTPLTRVNVGDEFFVRLRVRATNSATDRRRSRSSICSPAASSRCWNCRPPADSSTPDADPAMRRQRGASGSLPVGVAGKSDWSPVHVDVREDRLILYGDIARSVGTFVYRVRANNAGVFQVPPAFAEGLYNRTVVGIEPCAPRWRSSRSDRSPRSCAGA